ncbi:acetylcholine receptor subunit alpha-like [Physella acuta]|uniref:acetylcholine receptor subunit alpha-like n=1 Tax=Physella acuta TaxID=109671 RepID=UPI0027DAEC15|nr:acetylcholine receptor subunit alpha-like [Physella acuta]
MDIFNDVLNSARYNPKVSPRWNQTNTMCVDVTFELVSIVELDDVQQSFTCNGFLGFDWVDEIVAMTLTTKEMSFTASIDKAGVLFFTTNGEWDYLGSNVTASYIDTVFWNLSSVDITFFVKRRPTFLLINIILPVVFLSFLNLLVFVIPVESGDKVNYGITVLLALSVYMSMVSSLLTSSSLTTPKLTLYLFILLIISMLTVIDSIVIVVLDNLEEKEGVHLKAQENFQSAVSKVKILHRAVTPVSNMTMDKIHVLPQGKQSLVNVSEVTSFNDDVTSSHSPTKKSADEEKYHATPRRNKYKVIGKHIDAISFVVFFFIWISVTLGFLFDIAF